MVPIRDQRRAAVSEHSPLYPVRLSPTDPWGHEIVEALLREREVLLGQDPASEPRRREIQAVINEFLRRPIQDGATWNERLIETGEVGE